MRRHVARELPHAKPEHQLHFVTHAIGARPVRLVDDEEIRRLHQSGLERLNRVAGLRNDDEHAGVRGTRDIELALAHAHRLDEQPVEAERVQHVAHIARRRGESAERAARGHRADENAVVERNGLHANAIAE